MRNFSDEQGRTRVFVEEYIWYSADGNPRRTPLSGKRAIYGWKLDSSGNGNKEQGSDIALLLDFDAFVRTQLSVVIGFSPGVSC
jgi:hypothetical protein